jgi:uncharacterized protein (TIGR02217 family)
MEAGMSFHEVRLPTRLAFGSTGGVERRTEVVQLASGFERRSTPWAHGRRRWLIGAGVRSLDDMAELLAFFEARRGRLFGFRFKDFADWKSCRPGGTPSAADQTIGTGDGVRTQFQLSKSYGAGDHAAVRTIAKPVAGSIRVAVAGAELASTAFEVDAGRGAVSLNAAPPSGAAVTAGFAFDVPVRFDSDRLDVTLEGFEAGRIAAVPLIEIRI